MSAQISVIVYTKNEEQDLPGCLATLAFSDDVHVFDSCSDDRTVELAKAAGAHVTQRPFDTEAVHRNWAMDNIPFRYEWVYHADADERVTPALAAAMDQAVASGAPHVAYRVRRRDYFMGKWLRRSVPSPTNIRLFRHAGMRYERMVNPVPRFAGTVGEIGAHFDHFPFSKGLAHWFQKHDRYSTMEARQIVENRKGRMRPSLGRALFDRDYTERRFHQKELFYRMPCRPIVKFLYMYVGKLGVLDGRAGLDYAVLMAIYEQMIVLKTRELELASQQRSL